MSLGSGLRRIFGPRARAGMLSAALVTPTILTQPTPIHAQAMPGGEMQAIRWQSRSWNEDGFLITTRELDPVTQAPLTDWFETDVPGKVPYNTSTQTNIFFAYGVCTEVAAKAYKSLTSSRSESTPSNSMIHCPVEPGTRLFQNFSGTSIILQGANRLIGYNDAPVDERFYPTPNENGDYSVIAKGGDDVVYAPNDLNSVGTQLWLGAGNDIIYIRGGRKHNIDLQGGFDTVVLEAEALHAAWDYRVLNGAGRLVSGPPRTFINDFHVYEDSLQIEHIGTPVHWPYELNYDFFLQFTFNAEGDAFLRYNPDGFVQAENAIIAKFENVGVDFELVRLDMEQLHGRPLSYVEALVLNGALDVKTSVGEMIVDQAAYDAGNVLRLDTITLDGTERIIVDIGGPEVTDLNTVLRVVESSGNILIRAKADPAEPNDKVVVRIGLNATGGSTYSQFTSAKDAFYDAATAPTKTIIDFLYDSQALEYVAAP